MITISVVIPTYNYGRFIGEALESVLHQTFKAAEIVVVDDGSTDNTREVLAPYMQRIRYIHQANAGLSAARNTGIHAATSEWIALLDSDDTWHPEKLAQQALFAAEHPEISVIASLESSVYRKSGRFASRSTALNTRDFFGGCAFGPSGVMVRRSHLLRAGVFDESLKSVEDRDLWLKLSTLGPAARLNMPLWTYRRHGNQMHSNAARMQESYLRVLTDFFAAHPEHRRHRRLAYGYYHFDSAEEYNVNGHARKALAHILRSFLLHPWPLPRLSCPRRFNRAVLLAKCLVGEQRLSAMIRWMRGKGKAEPSPA
jgi:glycosyltransferase involved in cell wall biosynthesis